MGTSAFKNEPLIDWSKKENINKMRWALARVRRDLGKTYPILINGKRSFTVNHITSLNPADFQEKVGLVSAANALWANIACEAALDAWQTWRYVSYSKRASYLFRAAEIMRKRRFELSAWAVLEVGKSWPEADADVAEAIDFLEFYGRRMLELGAPRLTEDVMGEINESVYVPRGAIAVIGVWNFPWAINIGMISAALVAGNTVVFKPASASVVIGYKIAEIFHEAGLPDGVLNFLSGSGGVVGEALAKNPKVIGIAVTGSRDVGMRLHRICGEHPCDYGFKEIIVGEFGGKDKILIDEDADLDEAVKGVRDSWLGYQGQKCSACSVVIVLDRIYDRFLARLVGAAQSVKIGSPENPECFMGPLIDGAALERVKRYLEIGKKEGRLVYVGEIPTELASLGYYHPPVIFADVAPEAVIAQEEIFGPLLTIVKARDFDQAVTFFNLSDYALTGGLFSRLPSHITRAKQELNAGNLYINRKITGASVGRQPFGGWKHSGVGSKAGGPEYLLRFMYIKTISENTICRGFVPQQKMR